MRAGLVQLTVGDDPAENLPETRTLIRAAVQGGAGFVLTPECTNALSSNRARQRALFRHEAEDPTLAALREEAARAGVWLLIGSLGVLTDDPDGRFANRSFLIAPDGAIAARYDKIHMFDVDLATGESWRESNAYEAGRAVVTVEDTPVGRLGLAVCYDMRFPALFGALGDRRCDAIAVAAAFTRPTGAAHWHVLLRARAIEAQAFVIAAAQVGRHEDGRETYGHSLVIDPWGEVLLDMGGEAPGLALCDIDLGRIAEVRAQVPALANRREIAKS